MNNKNTQSGGPGQWLKADRHWRRDLKEGVSCVVWLLWLFPCRNHLPGPGTRSPSNRSRKPAVLLIQGGTGQKLGLSKEMKIVGGNATKRGATKSIKSLQILNYLQKGLYLREIPRNPAKSNSWKVPGPEQRLELRALRTNGSEVWNCHVRQPSTYLELPLKPQEQHTCCTRTKDSAEQNLPSPPNKG